MTEEGKFPRCLIEKIDDQALAPDGFFELAEEVSNACLKIEGISGAYVSVTLVTGGEIRKINREMRNVDKETDVLSFPSVSYAPGKTARTSEKRLKKAYDPSVG